LRRPRLALRRAPDARCARAVQNVALLSRFVTETGAILPRRRTGITALKQRKLGNAIKVSRQMNLMPYLSKLPQHYDAKP
jgi:ribosomal protein S18